MESINTSSTDLRIFVDLEHLNLYDVAHITLALNVFPLSTINLSALLF